jgi:hypothetical protein
LPGVILYGIGDAQIADHHRELFEHHGIIEGAGIEPVRVDSFEMQLGFNRLGNGWISLRPVLNDLLDQLVAPALEIAIGRDNQAGPPQLIQTLSETEEIDARFVADLGHGFLFINGNQSAKHISIKGQIFHILPLSFHESHVQQCR